MVNILYNVIILELSLFFYILYDCVTVVTVIYDVTLNPNSYFQNKKLNRKKIKTRKKNKINKVYYF